MVKPRLLDAFCGGGGATRGYQLAGFHVVGVDHVPQPNYCGDEFIQMDALKAIHFADNLGPFAVIHASPPCEFYMRSGNVDKAKYPDLIGPVRDLLELSGVPWVIENVPGAPMRADVVLCGSMFGLTVRRHRWFELSTGVTHFPPFSCDHSRPIVGVYGNMHGDAGANRGMLPGNLESWSEGLGIYWMTPAELKLAIPPAYTRWIGERLLAVLPAYEENENAERTDSPRKDAAMNDGEVLGRYGHHPDPLIDAEVEMDGLDGRIAECHAVLASVLTLDVVTPKALNVKANVRRLLQDHRARD